MLKCIKKCNIYLSLYKKRELEIKRRKKEKKNSVGWRGEPERGGWEGGEEENSEGRGGGRKKRKRKNEGRGGEKEEGEVVEKEEEQEEKDEGKEGKEREKVKRRKEKGGQERIGWEMIFFYTPCLDTGV